MSLLNDKDYLILQLRLAYLRRVDDHAGPRVISVPCIANLPQRAGTHARQPFRSFGVDEEAGQESFISQGTQDMPSASGNVGPTLGREYDVNEPILPSYDADSPVVLAKLNDAQVHPELTALYSPKLTSDVLLPGQHGADDISRGNNDYMDGRGDSREANRARAASLGASGLKYTTTIYGAGRTGALGMRVSGRRNLSVEGKRRRALRATNGVDQASEGLGQQQQRGNVRRMESKDSVSSDKPMPRRVSDLSTSPPNLDDLQADTTPSSRNMQIPALAVQSSTYESDDGQRLGKRSASMRIPSKSSDPPAGSSAGSLAKLRSRSSSQPHRPGLPSGLSNVSAADDSDGKEVANGSSGRSTSDGLLGGRVESEAKGKMPKAVPPPRPPRKMRPSISERSTQSASAVADLEISGNSKDGFGSPKLIDNRQRSRSEAIMPGSMPPTGFSTSRDTSDADVSVPRSDAGPVLYMGDRTHSESTIFSLASPHVARQRGLSNRSQRSDGSGPLIDAAANERQPIASIEAVAEDPETQQSGHRFFDEAMKLSPSSRGRALSDPRDAMGNQNSYLFSKANLMANGDQFLLSTDGPGMQGAAPQSPSPEPTSFEPVGAAPLTSALGFDQGSMPPSLTPGISSAEAESAPRDHRKDGPVRAADLTRSTPSPFVKADPISVKKQFDSRSNKSALTALLSNRSEGPNNPFNQHYKNVAGSSVSSGSSTVVEVFFPFTSNSNPDLGGKTRSGALALHPATRSMRLSVRKDATMEELIGYGLYCYVEEDWRPRLEDALSPDATDEQRGARLSTVAWTLRLIEDGEVDDDYPAIDRSLSVGKFGADELAVCEATPAQIKQNQSASAMFDRRASRYRQITTGMQRLKPPPVGRQPVTPTVQLGTVPSRAQASSMSTLQGTPVFGISMLGGRGDGSTATSSGSIGGSRSYLGSAAPIFLRILVTPNPEVRYKTTLQVTSDRYLADVLETICKRRELGNADRWAFMVPDKDIVVPLDRTVESLQGNYDLALVRRQDLGVQHSGALTTQSTNPNASIFKRMSQPERPRYQASAKENPPVYKSYTVNRRMPTFLGRHERILTIDGDWLHIIPTDTRAFQTHTATTSYPISSIVSCMQSRLPSSFKLIVTRENDQKRYDFEADSSKAAAEIVQEINAVLRRR